MKTLKEKIIDILNEDENFLLADGFDDAFVGIGRQFGRPIAVYDRFECIELLIKEGMSEEEAEEYFQFNVEGAWVGENTPIFLEKLY
jgi:hypothetical protein